MTLFLATFTTLLAIINPLEALPVYLGFVEGKDLKARRSLAIRSCLYALALMFFFLLFGTLLLEVFGVSLSMVRIAGGIILTLSIVAVGLVPEIRTFTDLDRESSAGQASPVPEEPSVS